MKRLSLAVIGLVGLWLVGARASGPIGVYTLVDKVTFEPNAEHPQRIRISGVFILSSVPDGCGSPSNPCSTSYGSPQRGYLYYSLPDRGAEEALREWADLKSLAGTREVAGFGSGWYRNDAKVKREAEKPDAPLPWPMNNGVVKVNSSLPQAKALLEYKGQ